MLPTRSEAIKKLLIARAQPRFAEDYNENMEVQVNVAQGNGRVCDSEKGYAGRLYLSYENDSQRWYPFRIPRNASTEPEYTPVPMTYDLAEHVEGIGMTGWDWKNRVSRWVGYDVDAIIGHSERHVKKLTDEEIANLMAVASKIPWVTIRKSASGNGLHLYVYLTPVPTANHTEHAALARAILSYLSAETKYDFSSKVDVCGSNIWVYHRKGEGKPEAFKLVKEGTVLTDIPANWRDHVLVIAGKKRRAIPTMLEKQVDTFDALTGQDQHIPLDDSHKKLIDYLKSVGAVWWWDTDYHMLITHTTYLKDAHRDLAFRGVFETTSTGSEKGMDINCFLFPGRNGSWMVRRYTPGAAEHHSWQQDGKGWTRCYLNKDPDLKTAALTHQAGENTSGAFVFTHLKNAKDAARMLGIDIALPETMNYRPAQLEEHKDGRIIVTVKREPTDTDLPGWVAEKKEWVRIYSHNVEEDEVVTVNDDILRHIVSIEHEDAGWMIPVGNHWNNEPLSHVKPALKSMSLSNKEIDALIGGSVRRPWEIVNRPFQPEYPGDRKWNRGAAQLAFVPTQGETLNCPTWLMLINHIGANLKPSTNEWCVANGIKTGGDYLLCWIASMFKDPLEPLPYLFLYSNEQETGKSLFHEALALLMSSGVQKANAALENPQGFNGELEHAVLCVVEEKDIRSSKVAYARIKEWVTGKTISSHVKGATPRMVENSTHWIQCANDASFCPLFPGDTRIVVIKVNVPANKIPKKEMLQKLKDEAPDFLATVLRITIPPCKDRLNIPVLNSLEKDRATEANRTPLEEFIAEKCYSVPGSLTLYSDFYEAFVNWFDPTEHGDLWSKKKMSAHLPDNMPSGRRAAGGETYVANVSLVEGKVPSEPFKLNDDGLLRQM